MKGQSINSPTTEQLETREIARPIGTFLDLSEYVRKNLILKFLDTMAAGLAVSNIGIQYFINEYLFYSNNYTYSSNYTTNTLCFINMSLVFVLLITISIRYLFKYKILNLKYDNYRLDPNEQSLKLKMFIEIFICSFFLPPYLNYSFKGTMLHGTYNYHLGEILLLLMIPRLYLVPRLYEHYSKWTGSRAKMVCRNYSAISDAVFAFKSDLKIRPFYTIGVIFTFLVVVIGIGIMQAERHFTPEFPRNLDMSELTNNQWMIFVTMATIGYGEIFPTTHHGRFLAIIACVCGMILVSALIVALNSVSEFKREQRSAYLLIKSRKNYDEWIGSAVDVIKAAMRCANYKLGSIKKLKMIYFLKQAVYQHERTTKVMSKLSVTSSEMLHELHRQAENKFNETKKIVLEIPKFHTRIKDLGKKQENIEKVVDMICEQQKIIFEFVKTKFPNKQASQKAAFFF